MNYIDFILNLVGLLLWLNWRSLGLMASPAAVSLAANLKPAGRATKPHRWVFLVFLGALLLARTVFYWYLGGPLEWTPKLFLGVQVIPFRVEALRGVTALGHLALYSLLSFGLALAVFYLWLLLVSAINWKVVAPDPITKLARSHLGRMGRWPMKVQLALPFGLAAVMWPALRYLFTGLQMMPAAMGGGQVLVESLALSLAVVLSWKYLLLGLLALYFAHSYVFFGGSPFWEFVNLTGKNLLGPLRGLRVGKLDLAPVVGMGLVLGICYGIEHWPQWLLPKVEVPGVQVAAGPRTPLVIGWSGQPFPPASR